MVVYIYNLVIYIFVGLVGVILGGDLTSFQKLSETSNILNEVSSEYFKNNQKSLQTDISKISSITENQIFSYVPNTLNKAQLYAANLVAIAKVHDELYKDYKMKKDNLVLDYGEVQDSIINSRKQALDAQIEYEMKEKRKWKQGANRAVKIYLELLNREPDTSILDYDSSPNHKTNTLSGEGKGIYMAHNDFVTKGDNISLPNLDESDYEPLNVDDSLLSINESPMIKKVESIYSEMNDRLEDKLDENHAMDKLQEADEDLTEEIEHISYKKENEKLDLENKEKVNNRELRVYDDSVKSAMAFSLPDDESVDLANDQSALYDEDTEHQQRFTSIENKLSQDMGEIRDGINEVRYILPRKLLPNSNFFLDLPDYIKYVYVRCKINALLSIYFLEIYVLPILISSNEIRKNKYNFRSNVKFQNRNSLYSIASIYNNVYKRLSRLPYQRLDKNQVYKILQNVQQEINTLNNLMVVSLRFSPEEYKVVANIIRMMFTEVRDAFNLLRPVDLSEMVDSSFLSESSPYSAPKSLFPQLNRNELELLSHFDIDVREIQTDEGHIYHIYSILSHSPHWESSYITSNSIYQYRRYNDNLQIRKYVDFDKFGMKTPNI